MRRRYLFVLLAASLVWGGCSDDDESNNNNTPADTGADAVADTGDDTSQPNPDTGNDVDMQPDTGPDVDMQPDTGPDVDMQPDGGVESTTFRVTVENTSNTTAFPLPLSPGVWAVYGGDNPLFAPGEVDRGEGLEAVAEDGKPMTLADSLAADDDVAASAAFSTDGPIGPGGMVQFDIQASPDAGKLALATMFIPSNDVFLAPQTGIDLFDDDGSPLAERDVTEQLGWWNAGTERDEAPNQGPNQVQRQDGLDDGPAEGVIARFDNTTRALPAAGAIADVSVAESDGTFTVTVENVSVARGAIKTPLSPVVWAIHGSDFAFFEPGTTASDGLEGVAEDGTPMGLKMEASADADVSSAGVAKFPDAGSMPGPILPGSTYAFDVTPDADHTMLSIATMVVQSNDAFLAFTGGGVALVDAQGEPRASADIAADISRQLGVWDAGTEANEVPGAGANQKPRQPSNDVGPDDPNDQVRFYADPTNDLAGAFLGGFVDVSVVADGSGGFDVTVSDTSGSTPYPGVVTPVVWATHADGYQLFEVGQPASAGLEVVAEDGKPMGLAGEVSSAGDVGSSGVANTAVGGSTPGPLMPGGSYTFNVVPDADHPQLSIASMVVPSNDTFLAFEPGGIALLDSSGSPRSANAIAGDIADSLHAWDAGTEANQAGAAGPDQAPRQADDNVGPAAGDGTIRPVGDDPVWVYPSVGQSLRVTIAPADSQ